MIKVLDFLEEVTDNSDDLLSSFESPSNEYEMYIFEELKKYVQNKLSKFLLHEIKRSSRTRSEEKECKESILAWIKMY